MTLAFTSAIPLLLQKPPCRVSSCISPRLVTSRRIRTQVLRMSATAGRDTTVIDGPFNGQFGQWYLTQADVDDVTVYRQALAVMCGCFTTATALSLFMTAPPLVYDCLNIASLIAFGVALQNIHIYAKPLHNALKALWALAVVGDISMLALPMTGHSAIAHSFHHPEFLLLIGWQFVALTGLFIKEAFCFGRTEALALIALTPLLSGGHFLNALPLGLEQKGAVVYCGFFVIFCARKFVQPVVDDLGDMSIFQYLAKTGKSGN